MWRKLKVAWAWVTKQWNRFEDWVASKVPGWKTKIIAAIGAVGSAAMVLQEYVSGLPLEKIITGKSLAITSIVLFSLTFWFRRLAR